MLPPATIPICYVGSLGSLHTERWVRYFAERGHETHLIATTISVPGQAQVATPSLGRAHVYMWHRIRVGRLTLDWAINAAALPVRVVQLRRLLRRLRPAVLHAHYLNEQALFAALSGFRPLVVTAWGSDILLNPRRSRVLLAMVRFVLRRADLVTCDARHMRQALVELGATPEKIRIINFGTNTEWFTPACRDPDLRLRLELGNAPTILSTRKLEPIYDVGSLVAAMAAVVRRRPAVKLLIAGSGSEERALREAASRLGLRQSVRFVGWLTEAELRRYTASCDIYVSTALSDGGIAGSTAEAMASGLPVIVTDVGDNRDWVHDGVHGFVVPPRSPERLAERIVELIDDAEGRSRLGANGRALIARENNWMVEMEKMALIYEALAQRYETVDPQAGRLRRESA